MRKRTYMAGGSLGAVMLLALSVPQASANWSSYIDGGRVGFLSRDWDDVSYSEITFKSCRMGGNYRGSVDIQLIRRVGVIGFEYVGPSKHFTACFEHGGSSTATWTGLEAGTYFFRIQKVGGRSDDFWPLDVLNVLQDTTKAD